MDRLKIREEVLGSAVEDYCGLWEFVWGLRPLLPDSSEDELRDVAESEIRELVKKGQVALYRRVSVSGDAIPLAASEIEAALARPTNWQPPSAIDSEEIVVGATDLGVRDYYAGALE